MLTKFFSIILVLFTFSFAIDDPTAITFSNEEIRTVADDMAQLYNKCRALANRWYALGGTDLIPNVWGDTLQDGAVEDGRPVIHGADVNNVMTRVIEFITDYEASGNAKLNTVLKVAVNPNKK